MVMSIKRLAAPSNAYQIYTEYNGIIYRYGTGSGLLAPSKDGHMRSGYSINPVKLFDGTPWRYPSNYSRYIRRFEKITSSRTNKSTAWSIPSNDSNGVSLTLMYPPFYSARRVDPIPSLRNEAIVKALNKISSRKMSLGVSIGESVKAATMLSTTAMKAFAVYKAAKRGNWPQVERLLGLDGSKTVYNPTRQFANKWLELQYGWLPLFSDLHDQYETLRYKLEKDGLLVHGTGGASYEATTTDEFYDTSHNIFYSRKRSGRQLCTVGLTAKITSESWRRAGQVGGINPLEVAWELVPFSFVLDWFMPVGNVLEALTAKAGLEFVGGHVSYVTEGRGELIALRTNSSLITLFQKGHVVLNHFGTSREKLTSWPTPTLYADSSPFSTKRVLNALALWRSITSGGVPHHIRS